MKTQTVCTCLPDSGGHRWVMFRIEGRKNGPPFCYIKVTQYGRKIDKPPSIETIATPEQVRRLRKALQMREAEFVERGELEAEE